MYSIKNSRHIYFSWQAAAPVNKREWKQSTQTSLLGGAGIVLKLHKVERATGL